MGIEICQNQIKISVYFNSPTQQQQQHNNSWEAPSSTYINVHHSNDIYINCKVLSIWHRIDRYLSPKIILTVFSVLYVVTTMCYMDGVVLQFIAQYVEIYTKTDGKVYYFVCISYPVVHIFCRITVGGKWFLFSK